MTEIEHNDELIPSKELMKRRRKAAYEAKKAQQKAEKKAEKEAQRLTREQEREARDQELWDALRPAKQLETNENNS